MGEMEAFYTKLLAVPDPWLVERVNLDLTSRRVDIWLKEHGGVHWVCPECQKPASVYDHSEEGVWQHLDTCQCQTFLHARLPRTNCAEHGIRQVRAPWAGPRKKLTFSAECRVLDTLKECDVSGASRLTGMTWDRVFLVQQEAVVRGLARQAWGPPSHVGVDEKAFAKGHQYETLVCDLDLGNVVYVADDRCRDSLVGYFLQYSPEELAAVQTVTMKMWPPYIDATLTYVPDAPEKLVFDRFHVTKYLTAAVDQVRRREHKELMANHDLRLKKTKYLWLCNREHVPEARLPEFAALRQANLQTARAWAIKEDFRDFWAFPVTEEARRFFKHWYFWATHSRLDPIISAAKTIKAHFENIVTYIKHKLTNAAVEGLNSKIQTVKQMACGFRNREHYKAAIYFHCGGLDLYPRPDGA